jgi:PAS domain S-box-containing protein
MSVGASTERIPPLRLLRRSFAVFLVTLVLIILAFLTILALSLYEAGRNNAVSKTAALEQYVRRSLEVSTVVAGGALAYLHLRGSLAGLAEDFEAHSYFSGLAVGMSLGDGIIFVDGDGAVVLHSDSFPAPRIDLSDRAWFRAHLEGADRYIDGSFISRVTGTLLFVHTFALRDADGVLQGAVNIGIPSDNILGAQALPFGDEEIVTAVFKDTGQLIARDPFPRHLIGARRALPDRIQEGSSVFETRALDGRRALTAYSRLEDFDLVASVSIPIGVVFQPLVITAAATLPLIAMIVFGASWALRHLEAQQRQLVRSTTRLEAVLQASSLGAWQWFPKIDRTEFLGRWAEMLGYRQQELEPSSATWKRLLHPDEEEHLLESLSRLLSGEQDEFCEEHRMRHKDGHWVWVLDSGRVVERDAKGQPEIVVGIHLDISERREAEERMRAVSLEVDHRSKNILAVVQALVSMTRFDSEEAFKSTLRGRIQALSRAHELLSRSRWKGADLRAIAEDELSPYTGRAVDIVIDGPPAFLGAAAIQALAMTLHELATNAAKYGALSVPDGRLRLTWHIPEDGPTFTILWEETGEPASGEPSTGSGFGSRLLHLMIERQLGGKLEIAWSDNGLRCRMDIPKSLLLCPSMDPTDQPARAAPELVSILKAAGTRERILLVEDEALVAAENASRLEAAGYVVIGSASSLQEATALAGAVEVEAAVLDLNLGGKLSFPIADILLARGVPFVFVTGYEHEGLIPSRFARAPVMAKPTPPDALEKALADAFSARSSQRDDGQAVRSVVR